MLHSLNPYELPLMFILAKCIYIKIHIKERKKLYFYCGLMVVFLQNDQWDTIHTRLRITDVKDTYLNLSDSVNTVSSNGTAIG